MRTSEQILLQLPNKSKIQDAELPSFTTTPNRRFSATHLIFPLVLCEHKARTTLTHTQRHFKIPKSSIGIDKGGTNAPTSPESPQMLTLHAPINQLHLPFPYKKCSMHPSCSMLLLSEVNQRRRCWKLQLLLK